MKDKQAFVHYFGSVLERAGCKITHAQGDADTVIVSLAVSCAVSKTTVVLWEDTDLFCFYLMQMKTAGHFYSTLLSTEGEKHKELNMLWMKSKLGP